MADGDTGADPRPRNVKEALVSVTETVEEQSFPRSVSREDLIAQRPVSIELSPLPSAAFSRQHHERHHRDPDS